MKAIKFIPMFFLAGCLSGALFAQSDAKEQLTVPLSDPAKPCKLVVNLTSGSINVTGYAGKEIVIDVQGDAPRKNERTANGMRRLSSGGSVDITAREEHNTVTVGSGIPVSRLVLNIKVPISATNIKLRTVNGGTISVSNIGGDLELSNTNGGIKAENVSGSVVANTVNGSVNVSFKSVDGTAPMAFTTLNGNVDVTFPATLKANLKLKSDRGDVFSDFDMATDSSQPKSTKTSTNGTYRIMIEDWINGKIGGGGPEMLMKNMNGNIYIRKAK
ncbi:DUF4097 family beta strand repeat-containing protein [Hufsiella ginkgonis]|uniref:DUF4097 family beta strand repeat protein n=1 Tax=Hufsiella ginkgonis TaxID=2695274 RepID=A0A7K1Y3D0_9SPHI|nr:DUF4097 family beta strand repeat-containing protein [Hufsiella ginkgonis]MXV17751.1 DUF4097 family beta strand repeat protein [Hufsiella ginkgonis]